MKWYMLSIGLVFFIIYRSTKAEINLRDGSKRIKTIDQHAEKAKIIPGENNNTGIYNGEMNSSEMTPGLYTISNNSKVSDSRRWQAEDRIAFLINGNHSSKKEFVNGSWVTGNNFYGGFYLAKAIFK
jgi:hypothetical protein